MKIGLCQINPTVGAFTSNRAKVLASYRKLVQAGADLIVFPELVLSGYPPQDLLWEEGFVATNLAVLDQIRREVTVPVILGYIRKDENGLYNSAACLSAGELVCSYDKQLLPTYDVFDEYRYFIPGATSGVWQTTISGRSVRIGLEICEDLWDDEYATKVTRNLLNENVDIIVNISASPFQKNRLSHRLEIIKEKVRGHATPFIYCNLVGAQDELIFDGQSMILDEQQRLVGLGTPFEEDHIIVDINTVNDEIIIDNNNRNESIYHALCLGVKDYFAKSGHRDAIISLSGGIDSAVVACIAADALGTEHVHTVCLPSKFSSDHSLTDAKKLAANLGVAFMVIPIQDAVDQLERDLAPVFAGQPRSTAEENIQARIRGNLVMAMANKFGWMVLSTGNKTEMALGYCTLYGDMSGGLAVISDVSKEEIYALANWVNEAAGYARIPENIIRKTPSAELAPDQVDPFDYAIVSPLVDEIVENRKGFKSLVAMGYEPDLVRHVSRLIRINEFKRRQAAPGLRVSKKAFGVGRRIPIINHYQGNRDE